MKTTTNNREYKIQLLNKLYPPYYDECWSYHIPNNNSCRKWRRKMITTFEVRMYKTWKYNRKTQWK